MSWDAAARRGDWEAAWAISDAVVRERDPACRDDPSLPYHRRWVWDGRRFEGRDVLVRCYHGLGDTLHFARYFRPLAARARRVTVEAPPPLVPLLRLVPGIAVHPFDPASPLAPLECDIESMELAHALRLRPDVLSAPWLRLPGPLVPRAGSVGLCWRGGNWDRARSVPLPELAPLHVGADRLWSLQLGEGGPAFANPGGCGDDLLETAQLVASLERVVTIDSMVAHLAGALGRPALVLLHADADWRWGAERERCRLYPAHKLLRQSQPGRWNDVLAQVAAHISEAVEDPSAAGPTRV